MFYIPDRAFSSLRCYMGKCPWSPPDTSASGDLGRPSRGPGSGSPPRRVPTRAFAARQPAATGLPARGSSGARPTSPVNSYSPRAASASPSAAHHFLRGSVGRPGSPNSLKGKRIPRPGGRTGLACAPPCAGGKGQTLPGRPVGEGGCGGPPLRDSGFPEEAPGSQAVGLGHRRPGGHCSSARLPGFDTSGWRRKEGGQALVVAPPSTYPSMAQTEQHSEQGAGRLAAAGGRRRQQGGSGDARAAPLPKPRPVGGARSGKQGRRPGTLPPPPRPRLPHPASASSPRLTPPLGVTPCPQPRPKSPSASAPGRPLPASALQTPPPGSSQGARTPCLRGSRARAPCTSRSLAPPARCGLRCLPASRPWPPGSNTSLYRPEKLRGPQKCGANAPRGRSWG